MIQLDLLKREDFRKEWVQFHLSRQVTIAISIEPKEIEHECIEECLHNNFKEV
jgi:hypothetical protein